jgi:hypothetical protein
LPLRESDGLSLGLAFVNVALDGITNLGVQFGHTVRFRKD